MKQVLIQQGGVRVEEVPPPSVEAGRVIVRVEHSCISTGTEMRGVRRSGLPLWKRALQSPQEVRKLIDQVRKTGLLETRELVRRKLLTAFPLGYSAAGTVVEIGTGVEAFRIGDRVACGGGGWASHAEYIAVPSNLAVPVPEFVDSKSASTVALGAIALQGIRRAAPTFGETVIVLGLGIIGQLTARLLRAQGIRVIGSDLQQERLDRALRAGLDYAIQTSAQIDHVEIMADVLRLTDGYGADAVIVTAASVSDDIIALAFQCCRKRARVVLVGDVGLNLQRADFYAKELDFLVSTSYGPGRYDRRFEEEGYDYPLPYVRWTETRNMSAYLAALAVGRCQIDDLLQTVFPITQAYQAYQALGDKDCDLLAALLCYREPGSFGLVNEAEAYAGLQRTIFCSSSGGKLKTGSVKKGQVKKERINLALVGAGGFVTSTLLPVIVAMPDQFTLDTIVTRNGLNGRNLARQFAFTKVSTDFSAVLRDTAIDAVLIATRHDSHGRLVLQALQAGKSVFVEKPLCLTESEATDIALFFQTAGAAAPLLQTGYNRRFSPYARRLVDGLAGRRAPIMISYRVNAGFIDRDHWVQGPEGGGRNLGEACHFYDFFTALTQAHSTSIQARSIGSQSGLYQASDNFSAQIGFADGSVANLVYTALGHNSHAKEQFDVFADGQVYSVNDFRTLTTTKGESFTTSDREKGYKEEMKAFADTLQGGTAWPIPLWQQLQATRIALCVQERLT